MTRAQEVIKKYIHNNFHPDSVQLFLVGRHKVKLIDLEGGSMVLTMNIFGDIMDAETKQIYAVSDLPHDLERIDRQLPKSWKEVDRV